MRPQPPHLAPLCTQHLLLSTSMLSSSLFTLLEAVWPRNILLTCGRIASVYLQGFFFIGAGHILYGGTYGTLWDADYGCIASMYLQGFYLISAGGTHSTACTLAAGTLVCP